MDFPVPADHKVKFKENEKKPYQRTEKTMEHKSDGETNCNWCARSWQLEETTCHANFSEKSHHLKLKRKTIERV